MKRLIALIALVLLVVPGAAQETATPEAETPEADTTEMAPLPDEVVFESPVPGLLPEGVEWDAEAGTFLVGSLSTGTIRAVADDGTVTERFTSDDLSSTIGIHIADGKLYVANSDASVMGSETATGLASLAVFDLETGEQLSFTDLTAAFDAEGGHFANDVTVDADGNAYVTDSFKPAIYMVTPEGEGSVFVTSELLSAEGFGLNGIDYHPDGYLLAAVAGAGAVIKIPLDDPEALAAVELSEPISIDGMALGSDGVLYAVGRAAGLQEIVALVSEDDWASAEIVARVPTGDNATTLALRDGAEGEAPAVYYVNTYFGQTDRTEYQIVRADLEMTDAMAE